MAAGDTILSICSRALLAIGADEISSFEDGTIEAKVAKAKYDTAKKDLLALYFWTFSLSESYLARSADEELTIYKYLYALPEDCLRAVTVREDSYNIDYTFRKGMINTDADKPILLYVADCKEEFLPSYFISLLIDRLARDFLIPITGKEEQYKIFDTIYQTNFATAKSADAQAKTPRKLNTNLLIGIR